MLRLFLTTLLFCFAYAAHASSPPRCLPGDYPSNFHVEKDTAGDTLAVLWCDDAIGIGVNVLGWNLTTVGAASKACQSALEAFAWTVTWETSIWKACIS